MSDDPKTLMPDDTVDSSNGASGLPAALICHIQDCIEDAKTLRDFRPKLAKALIFLAFFQYIILFVTIFWIGLTPYRFYWLFQSQTLTIVIVLVLAVLPTAILITVSRAVFGHHSRPEDVPYTPIQTVIQIMKDMGKMGS